MGIDQYDMSLGIDVYNLATFCKKQFVQEGPHPILSVNPEKEEQGEGREDEQKSKDTFNIKVSNTTQDEEKNKT